MSMNPQDMMGSPQDMIQPKSDEPDQIKPKSKNSDELKNQKKDLHKFLM